MGQVSKIGASRVARAMSPSMYAVTLVTPDGEQKIECDGDTYVLDKAEEEGLVRFEARSLYKSARSYSRNLH
eukprot:6209244-Pleurochrysis_carterae.AAC.2